MLELTVYLDCVSDLTGRIYDAQVLQTIQEKVIIYVSNYLGSQFNRFWNKALNFVLCLRFSLRWLHGIQGFSVVCM